MDGWYGMETKPVHLPTHPPILYPSYLTALPRTLTMAILTMTSGMS